MAVARIYTLLLSATMAPLATSEPEIRGQNTFSVTTLGEDGRSQVELRHFPGGLH
ncbi:MAG: hypothetical protein OXE98_05605 [Hyphomicrobiales bacterium]|nr:hypothetical protein [Hyphomicrobiales bacterium]